MSKFLLQDDDTEIKPREFISGEIACQALQHCIGSLLILDAAKDKFVLGGGFNRPMGDGRIWITRAHTDDKMRRFSFAVAAPRANDFYRILRGIQSKEAAVLHDESKGTDYGITKIKLIGGSAFVHIDNI